MKKINDPALLYALAVTCTGEADEASQRLVKQWLSEDPANRKMLEYLKHTTFGGEIDESMETRERIYSKIMQRIQESETQGGLEAQAASLTGKAPILSFRRYAAIAAMALILILGGIYLLSSPGKESNLVAYSRLTETATVMLDDGTMAELNAGSTLSYPETFRGKERRVQLKGEAFFEVARDEKHPFIVEIGNAEIRVLGTKFNAKAYEGEHKIVTTLLEGSVVFSLREGTGEPVVLQPNQQIIFDRETGESSLAEVDAALIASWKKGIYYFDHVSLDEIAGILGRGYGIVIENRTTGMEGEHFSGMFEKEIDPLQILDMLKRHRAFDYEKKGDKIILFDQ